MNEKDFQRLLTGVRQMKAILAGKMKPARDVQVAEVRMARTRLNLTQKEFARLINVPVATLKNWEQGRTQPDGPSRALLTVACKQPAAVLKALHRT